MGTLASCYCTDEMKEIPNKRVCSFTIFRIKREMQGQLFYYLSVTLYLEVSWKRINNSILSNYLVSI